MCRNGAACKCALYMSRQGRTKLRQCVKAVHCRPRMCWSFTNRKNPHNVLAITILHTKSLAAHLVTDLVSHLQSASMRVHQANRSRCTSEPSVKFAMHFSTHRESSPLRPRYVDSIVHASRVSRCGPHPRCMRSKYCFLTAVTEVFNDCECEEREGIIANSLSKSSSRWPSTFELAARMPASAVAATRHERRYRHDDSRYSRLLPTPHL